MNTVRPRTRRQHESVCLTDGGGPEMAGTLVGLTTQDGVLLAADTRASQMTVVRGEHVRKIEQVHPTAAIGSTDRLGSVQSFVRALRLAAERYELNRGNPMTLTELGTVAVEELRSQPDSGATFVLGGVDDGGSHLFELSRDGGLLADEVCVIGSGREVAAGVLEADAMGSLTMAEGRRLAGRALESSAERDTRTGVGVHVAEITDAGVAIHASDSIDDLL